MLTAAVLLYFSAFVYFYPLTLRFHYENGRTELAWLPRLCGGYAAPRSLALPRPSRGGDEEKSPGERRRFKLSRYRPLLMRLLSHTAVDKLECRIKVGAADPFATSMLAGLIMASLGGLGGVASAAVKSFPARPWLKVITLKQGGLTASLECIFHIRCGDIIGDTCYYFWLKTKGRRAHGK